MLERYRPVVESLGPAQRSHLLDALATRHGILAEEEGQSLYDVAAASGLDQADLVMSLARDYSPIGVSILETLVGQPLRRQPPAEPEPAPAPRRPPQVVSDPRVIVAVVPNPKRPGSAAHERYQNYAVGITADEALSRGLRRDDLRSDEARGYITLEVRA